MKNDMLYFVFLIIYAKLFDNFDHFFFKIRMKTEYILVIFIFRNINTDTNRPKK